MIWLIFGLLLILIALIFFIIYLLDIIQELQYYRNDNEVKKIIHATGINCVNTHFSNNEYADSLGTSLRGKINEKK